MLDRRSYDAGVAALAYSLLSVTGLLAFLTAADARVRFHGLQAIAIGLGWALLLYAAAVVSERLTQFVFAAGVLVWLAFLLATLLGRDPKLPLLGRALASTASYELGDPGNGLESSGR